MLLFGTKKRSNTSEELYFAFPTLEFTQGRNTSSKMACVVRTKDLKVYGSRSSTSDNKTAQTSGKFKCPIFFESRLIRCTLSYLKS